MLRLSSSGIEEFKSVANWAVKKLHDGSIDIRGNLRGDQLIEYIKDELFPYLKSFSETSEGKDSLEYKIGAIFNDGVTVLRNCAKEPEVLELANYLNSCGAKIEGAGESNITITGVKSLKADRWKCGQRR